MQYPTQDKSARKYNRRVELLKPESVESDYNEAKTTFVKAFGNFPAKRFDQNSNEGEKEESNVIKGVSRIKWELRFIPDLIQGEKKIKTDWKIKDLFDGQIYNIIAPPTEVGFRQGISVLTEIVQ